MLTFRPTRKPAKRLIYLLLQRDSKLSQGRKVGVDFGCKGMKNRPLFKTAEYYGVDLDAGALTEGLARYPDAKAIHAKIEEANVPPADFALCINVFGATNFGESNSVDVVRRIIDCMAPGGVLLMTLKHKAQRYNVEEHVNLLRAAFHHVETKPITLNISWSQKPSVFNWSFLRPLRLESLWAYFKARHHLSKSPPAENPDRVYCRCIGKK